MTIGPKKTPWVKAMDFLARRDHSEKELREKLARDYDDDEIETTIQEVKERGWLLPPEELSEKVTNELHRKRKGHLYILNFLRQKGLPEVPKNPEIEMEKALQILESKMKDPGDTQRTVSLLKNRGFDTETITRVLHEIRRNSPSIY